MIAAISLIRRRADLTVPAYRKHWLEVHGPLAAKLPGVRSYVQSHVIETAATNALAKSLDVNGFAQLWLDSEEARVATYESEQEKICDVDSLLWIGASARIVTEFKASIPVAPERKGGRRFKQVLLVLKKPGAQPIALDIGKLRAVPGVQGLVDHTIVRQGAAPTQKRERVKVELDGFYELSFESQETMERSKTVFEEVAGAGAAGRVACFGTEDFRIV